MNDDDDDDDDNSDASDQGPCDVLSQSQSHGCPSSCPACPAFRVNDPPAKVAWTRSRSLVRASSALSTNPDRQRVTMVTRPDRFPDRLYNARRPLESTNRNATPHHLPFFVSSDRLPVFFAIPSPII